jgi:hypothetical protein
VEETRKEGRDVSWKLQQLAWAMGRHDGVG